MTTTTTELLERARSAGLVLGVNDDGELEASGPKRELSRFKPALTERKAELLALLAGDAAENGPDVPQDAPKAPTWPQDPAALIEALLGHEAVSNALVTLEAPIRGSCSSSWPVVGRVAPDPPLTCGAGLAVQRVTGIPLCGTGPRREGGPWGGPVTGRALLWCKHAGVRGLGLVTYSGSWSVFPPGSETEMWRAELHVYQDVDAALNERIPGDVLAGLVGVLEAALEHRWSTDAYQARVEVFRRALDVVQEARGALEGSRT